MLKIEVIKFEAQDVITTSVAAPVEAKCICPHENNPDGSSNMDAATECWHGGHPGCNYQGDKPHNCEYVS